MRAAVDALRGLSDRELLGYGAISVALTTALWDAPARGELLVRVAETARQAGALLTLDTALWVLALAELNGGTVTRAVAYNEQVREVRRAMGYDAENVVNAALMAWTEAPREHVVAVAEGSRAAGFDGVHTSAVGALAIRDLAEGHYRNAYRRLKPLIDDPFLQVTPLQFADYAEAAVRAGRTDDARTHAAQLARLADVNGSPWCRGVAERSRALVAPDDTAEAHYRAALDALATTDAEVELGRTHLLYGEWLRRVRRRRDARAALHAALAAFDRSGAHLFAHRALAELAAIGERPTPGPPDALDLTPRELTIARLAAAGQTNAEIAATLFISPNTVDYHLRKVFQKLGISSRRQLSERLS
jgi:DNA-binding CsgD family transcriptional regulator